MWLFSLSIPSTGFGSLTGQENICFGNRSISYSDVGRATSASVFVSKQVKTRRSR